MPDTSSGAPAMVQPRASPLMSQDPSPSPAPAPVEDPERRARREIVFLRATSLLLLLVGLWIAWPLRSPIVLALVTAFITYPLYQALLRRVRFPALAASIVLLVVALAFLIPIAIVVWLLVQQVLQVLVHIRAAGSFDAFVTDFLVSVGLSQEQASTLINMVEERLAGLIETILVWSLHAAIDTLIAVIVYFILLFFLLIEARRLLQFLRAVSPLSRDRRHRLLDIMGERVQAIVYGSLIVAVLQGLLAGIGWWLLGLPYPVFWGFVMLVLSVIPVVGAFVVLLPAAAWSFAQGHMFVGSALLVLNFVIVGLIDDVVRPYVIGRRSQVHPALVLIGIIGGLLVFGFIGIILGPLLLGLIPPIMRAWLRPGEGLLDQPPQ